MKTLILLYIAHIPNIFTLSHLTSASREMIYAYLLTHTRVSPTHKSKVQFLVTSCYFSIPSCSERRLSRHRHPFPR
ncbi:hypothetical protein F4680DRAFT_435632 [Xylaria scruposa]|nr:hypothetical protein F4680DRAFT_435632 [Xylaria scruposa]